MGIISKRYVRNLGIYYKTGRIVVIRGDTELRVNERVSLLGVSISSGIIGIITTLGATPIKSPLIFTLIPISLYIISLVTAIMEYAGLEQVNYAIGDIEH